MRFPKSMKIVSKSIAAGISAAGIVNTIAPGLFPTTMGYLAGSLRGTGFADAMVKIGLFSLGAFSTPTISSYGILAVGAVLGFVLGLILLPLCPVGRRIRRRFAPEKPPVPPRPAPSASAAHEEYVHKFRT